MGGNFDEFKIEIGSLVEIIRCPADKVGMANARLFVVARGHHPNGAAVYDLSASVIAQEDVDLYSGMLFNPRPEVVLTSVQRENIWNDLSIARAKISPGWYAKYLKAIR